MSRPALLLGCCLLVVGCGPTPAVDSLPGERVGKMAEQQLEAMHSDLATGTMTCPDLDFDAEASVRCTRTAVLSGGRQIRVHGTVTVTSVQDGGRLHVKLDRDVSEFGVTAAHLQADLAKRAEKVLGPNTGRATCSYLAGSPGTSVQCTVDVLGTSLITRITVTGTDEATYRTRYAFEDPLFSTRLNPSLPALLRHLHRDQLTP